MTPGARMQPQEELDTYGSVFVASRERHSVGSIIFLSLSVERPEVFGKAIVIREVTLDEFRSRPRKGYADPDGIYRYFHEVIAE
jgi:hypothetical protein